MNDASIVPKGGARQGIVDKTRKLARGIGLKTIAKRHRLHLSDTHSTLYINSFT